MILEDMKENIFLNVHKLGTSINQEHNMHY